MYNKDNGVDHVNNTNENKVCTIKGYYRILYSLIVITGIHKIQPSDNIASLPTTINPHKFVTFAPYQTSM